MSYSIKTASGAATALLSLTAAFIGGISWADDNVPQSAAQTAAPSFSAPSTLSGEPAAAVPVAFAVLQEGAPSLSTDTQPGANAPDDATQPEKSYESLAALVADTDVGAPLDEQVHCLATTVFYEARSETLEGQLAVARVGINRAKSARFGNSLCGVVRQPGQFSFVRSGAIPQPNTSHPHWRRAIAISRIALANAWNSAAEGALYFHARRVKTAWARPRAAVIDNHIFYR